MLLCYKCRIELTTENCYSNKSKKSSLTDICKKCQIDKNKEYYLNNKDSIKRRVCEHAKNNKDQHNARGVLARNRLRKVVFEYYSGGNIQCTRCGESQLPPPLKGRGLAFQL